MTQEFFSRNDRGSILLIEEIFTDSDKYVYFIEDAETHEWITIYHDWTKDPLKAYKFKSNMKARTYAVQTQITGWIITEHEFTLPAH